ncbi:MAG: hypothetical protein U5M50_08565 [Sphingobium sp.]|nr:hypothetical protein [Sphingobium sp.]
MAVDAVFAQWLQDAALWALGQDATAIDRWAETAVLSERITGLANRADALDEAARQLAFFGMPIAEDEHVVAIAPGGGWKRYLGQVITLIHPELGYAGGADVFLIGAEDDHAAGLSTLTVLRRL